MPKAIEFDNVSFRHSGGQAETKPVLDGFSLAIEAGDTLALVGRSGMGKTTILKLINRLLLPLFYPLRPAASGGALLQEEWLGTPFDDADELPVDFRRTIVPVIRRTLLIKCFVCIGLAIIGFFAGFNIAWTALAAATLLLCIAGWEPRQAFTHVDWPLLLFFAGLFIVVGGLRQAGVVERFFEWFWPRLGSG